MSSSGGFQKLSSIYKDSAAWKEAFKESPAKACTTAPSGAAGNSLCSSGGGSQQQELERQAQLVVATSPVAYSSANPADTGGLNLVGKARDQRPCGACVGFAVAAAAQTAIASAMRVNASAVEPLSVYDLLYCGTQSAAACLSGARLPGVLEQLTQRHIVPDTCLPYNPPGGPASRDAAANPGSVGALLGASGLAGGGAAGPPRQCSSCVESIGGRTVARREHPVAMQGTFSYRPLSDDWAVAEAIRDNGAVVSRFDIYSDFRDFFKDPKNKDAVYRPSPNAKLLEPHAVTIVGYNLSDGYWLVLNSWGPKFGDKGLFKVAFGAANIAKGPDLYTIQWTPSRLMSDDEQEPPRDAKGCFKYKAKRGDYLSGVARRFHSPLERLLLDNTAVVRDLDLPIAGLVLSICGSKRPLEVVSGDLQEAIDTRTLGVSWGGAGYLAFYTGGVLTVMSEAGLVDNKTKMTASGQETHCVMCAGLTFSQLIGFAEDIRTACKSNLNCLGQADAVLRRITFSRLKNVLDDPTTYQRCSGVCITGLSLSNPKDPATLQRFFEVDRYTSNADLVEALLASAFIPLFSNSKPSFTFRGQEVASGILTAFQPPPPPGVKYCVRVAATPAPEVVPTLDFQVAMSMYSKVQRSMSLDDLFGAGKGAAAAAAALAYKPTDAALRAAAEQALKLGVDIAPNLFTPLPLQDPGTWLDGAIITPTDDLASFFFELGKKDAIGWIRAMQLNGTRALPVGKLAGYNITQARSTVGTAPAAALLGRGTQAAAAGGSAAAAGGTAAGAGVPAVSSAAIASAITRLATRSTISSGGGGGSNGAAAAPLAQQPAAAAVVAAAPPNP